jgi:hypothetical protein
MKGIRIAALFLAFGVLAGLSANYSVADDKPKTAKEKEEAAKAEAEIKENLEKLTPEDRKIAEAQKFCAIDNENRLGEMGKPIKVMIKDQAVFLCCKGCQKAAEKDPEATLATVKELKKKNAPAPKDPK